MKPGDSAETSVDGGEPVFTEEMESVVAIERRGMQQPYRKGQKELAIIGAGFPDETRYYQLLNVIIDIPGAAQRWPAVVRILQERRAHRRAFRSGRP